MTLKVRITSARVRTGGVAHQPADAVGDVAGATWVPSRSRPRAGGWRPGDRARPPAPRRRPGSTNGSAMPAANRNAPERRPDQLVERDGAGHQPGVADAEVLAPDQHRQQGARGACRRTARRRRSATSRRRTTRMSTCAGRDGEREDARARPRASGSQTITIRRRSTRSASAPAYRPNSSQGSRCSTAASATRNGSWVCEATSSGPAARARPSPRLDVQDEREQPTEAATEPGRCDPVTERLRHPGHEDESLDGRRARRLADFHAHAGVRREVREAGRAEPAQRRWCARCAEPLVRRRDLLASRGRWVSLVG